MKLKKKAAGININFLTKPNLNIFQRIRNNKDKIKKEETAGIQRIKFTKEEGAEGSYIGMTKIKIKSRVKEHQIDIKLNKDSTALTKYNSENNIDIDFLNIQKLANYNSFDYAIKREAIEILDNPLSCHKMEHSLIDEKWRWMLAKK